MTSGAIEAPVRPPVCDWDSAPNPTFNAWTTVNLAEVFPGVAWPFDASWYHRWQTKYLRLALRKLEIEDLVPLYPWPIPNFLGFFAGQCAANVGLTTAIVSAYQVDGGSSAVEQFFTADQSGDARAHTAGDVARARRTRERFFRILAQMPTASLSDLKKAQKLTAQVRALELDRCSLPALRRRLEQVEVLAQNNFLHHALTSLGGAEYSSMLGEHLNGAIPGLPGDTVLTLTSGLGQVESARPSEALWELSRWVRGRENLSASFHEMAAEEIQDKLKAPPTSDWAELGTLFQEFIDSYGYRGQTEWMVALPDWEEDPSFPLNSLRNLVSVADSDGPGQLHLAATKQRIEAERYYRERLTGDQRRRYEWLLSKAKQFVRLREFTKANCIRGIRPGRHVVLAIGGHFERQGVLLSAADIFFLFAHEVDAILEGSLNADEAKQRVSRRRAQKQSLEAGYILPDNFVGEPQVLSRGTASVSVSTLSGLGVSPGTATGVARVVHSIDEASAVSLEPGEILVAPFTDAPWTPLFLVAAAVIVETGGLLSHAATVAREFGIPAVVMVKDATRIIQTGQRVTVDGGGGSVKLEG